MRAIRRAALWGCGLAGLLLGACGASDAERVRGVRVIVRVLWPDASDSRLFAGVTGVRLTMTDIRDEFEPAVELLRPVAGMDESAGAFDVRQSVSLEVDVLGAGDARVGTTFRPAQAGVADAGDLPYDGVQRYLVDLRNVATAGVAPSLIAFPSLFGVPLSEDASDYNQHPPHERRFTAYLETPAASGDPLTAVTTLVYPMPLGSDPFRWSLESGGDVIALPADLTEPTLTFTVAGAGRAEVRVTYTDPFDAARVSTADGVVDVEVAEPDGGNGNGVPGTARFRGRFVNADGSTIATGGGLFGIDPRTLVLDTAFGGGTFETNQANFLPRFSVRLFAASFFKTEVWRPVEDIVTHVVETVGPPGQTTVYNPNNSHNLVHNGATLMLPAGALPPTPTVAITSHGSGDAAFTRLFPGDFLAFDGTDERPFTSPAYCNFQPLDTSFAAGMTATLELNYPSLAGLDEELPLLHLGDDGHWRDAGVATRIGATVFRATIDRTGGWCLARPVFNPAVAELRLVRQDAAGGGNEPLRGRPVTYDFAGYAARGFSDDTGLVTLPVPPSAPGEIFFGRLQADGFVDWSPIEARTSAPFDQTAEVEYRFDAGEGLIDVVSN